MNISVTQFSLYAEKCDTLSFFERGYFMNAYDFDETVYAGECSIEFFLRCFKSDPSLIKFLPGVIKGFILYKQEKISLDSLVNDYGKVMEDYFSSHSPEIEKAVVDFWDKHINKIKPFYLRQKKEDDVIITASPEFLMREVCNRLGIKNLICTQMNAKTGKIEKPCFRESKTARFLERFPEGKIDEFYTDSMNDRFLMPFAEKVFIVKGSKIKRVK